MDQKKHYFEGWYYKQSNQQDTISFIVGFHTDPIPYCFIQVLTTKNRKPYYFTYPISCFSYQKHPFCVQIKKNRFYEDHIHIDIKEIPLKGTLYFQKRTSFKKSIYAPTIMGPLSYLKHLECNHDILSLHHQVHGSLIFQNQELCFDKGIGYIEKDYGTSFPKRYVWLQASNFKTSFVLALAQIPFLKLPIKGMFAVLTDKEKQYRFSSYDLASFTSYQTKDQYYIVVKQGNLKLHVSFTFNQPFSLKAPIHGKMMQTILESLTSQVKVSLYQQKTLLLKEVFQQASCDLFKWVFPIKDKNLSKEKV